MTEAVDAVIDAASDAASDSGVADPVEATAAALGWQKDPPEGWEGSWDDPTAFLAKFPAKLERLKSKAEKAEEKAKAAWRTSKTATAEARRRIEADAQARIDQAVEDGDKEAAREAAQDLANARKPVSGEVEAFVQANPWFDTHKRAKALAVATSADLELRTKLQDV